MCNFPDLNRFLLKPDLSGKAGVEHVEAWLEYKAGKLMYRGKKVTDPDSSYTARKFYRKMWGKFLKGTDFDLPSESGYSSEELNRCVLQGDWMCSVATTFRKGLIRFVEKNELENLFPEGSDDGVGGLNTYVPILLCDIACPNSKKQFQKFWNDPVLKNFIRSAYTLANLIIVPDGFNVARSRPTQDYWDETLERYFNNQEPLKRKPKNGDEIDFGTPFHDLVKASRANGGDELFLDEWFKDDKKSIKMLPKKDLTTLDDWRDDWHALMQEMTDRIDNRRGRMKAKIKK